MSWSDSSQLPRPTALVQAERQRLIAQGRIVPLEERIRRAPCLRLLPGEREKFEAHAKAVAIFPILFGSLRERGES